MPLGQRAFPVEAAIVCAWDKANLICSLYVLIGARASYLHAADIDDIHANTLLRIRAIPGESQMNESRERKYREHALETKAKGGR